MIRVTKSQEIYRDYIGWELVVTCEVFTPSDVDSPVSKTLESSRIE